jgi:hypothetical protein
LSPHRARRWLATAVAPATASLAFLLVPGPCTSFNDVDGAAFEGARDGGAEAGCDTGVQFGFYKGDSGACQNLAGELCCPLLEACSGNESCKTMIQCINDCTPPRPLSSSCVTMCANANMTESTLAGLANCFYDGGGAAARACVWIEIP